MSENYIYNHIPKVKVESSFSRLESIIVEKFYQIIV